MRSFFIAFALVFIALFSAPTFGAELAPPLPEAEIQAAKKLQEMAIASYRDTLSRAQKAAESRRDTALNECVQSRKNYLEASALLCRTQLERPRITDITPEITAANDAYRQSLAGVKTVYETQIEEAKHRAELSGSALVAASTEVERISAEIKRLSAEVSATELAGCMEHHYDSYEACRDYYPGRQWDADMSTTSGTYVPRPSLSESNRFSLPREFRDCFPNEVRDDLQPLSAGK